MEEDLERYGALLRKREDWNNRLEPYLEASEIVSKLGLERTELNVGKGQIYFHLRQFPEALKPFTAAWNVKESYIESQPSDIAQSLVNIGAVYMEMGELKEGISYYKDALPALGFSERGRIHVALLTTEGNELLSMGDLMRAIDAQELALEIEKSQTPVDTTRLARLTNNVAMVHSSFGN